MRKSVILLLLLFCILVLTAGVYAHQPRIVFDVETSPENPYIIENPEISQAFYGNLKGNPDFYMIKSEDEFKLYVNILAPDIEEARTDFVVEIKPLNVVLKNEGNWESFYEEFAGDNYLRGPELKKKVSGGEYLIIVSNKDNRGKYSLAVGERESFPINEIGNTVFILPSIKTRFFEKNIFGLFDGIIGKFILVIFIIILLVIWWLL